MLKILKNISQSVLGRFLTAFMVILLLINFMVLVTYVFHMHNIRSASLQQKIARHGVEIISLATLNPVKWQQYMMKAMQDPDVDIQITVSPNYQIKFTHHQTRWEIYDALQQDSTSAIGTLNYSYQLAKHKWLNAKINTYIHFERITLWVVFIGILTTLIIVFYSWSIQRFTDPLRTLTRATGKLGVDLDAKPLSVYGPNIVREAINSMNKMQERILALIKERTLTLAALSHDLRTPLTRLRLKAQFIRDQEQRDKFIYDLDEMQQMLNDTLILAKQHYKPQKMHSLDIVSLVEAICADMNELGCDVKFSATITRKVIKGDPLLLKRAIGNIINNAVKYGKAAVVNLEISAKNVIVTIDDRGPGIATAELDNVFEPFYRTESSRSKETGGTGLGLAIAKAVILSHDGVVSLSNLKAQGLRVTIRLPLNH